MAVLFKQLEVCYVGYAQIALERGVDAGGGLTYGVPETMAGLEIGQRVFVPLGKGDKKVAGYVVALAQNTELNAVKPILALDPHKVDLTPDLVQLARWMANYYCSPLGLVLANILPAAVKQGVGVVSKKWVGLSEMGRAKLPSSADSDNKKKKASGQNKSNKLSKLQRAALEQAQQYEKEHADDPWLEMRCLADLTGAKTTTPITQLIDKGLLIVQQRRSVQANEGVWSAMERDRELEALRVTLNAGQQRAVNHLISHIDQGFGVHLLYGVTASGKTEVYLRLIEHLLSADNKTSTTLAPGVIVLVPEIALTPQTARRFYERFDRVAVLHSGLTAAQRHEQWRLAHDGEANIVVGARSALFAPLNNLRLIIVDEEHETSYKQDQAPRYQARDAAIKRAHLLNIPCLLGSATPSLESYCNAAGVVPSESSDQNQAAAHQARSPHYHLLQLPDRVAALKLPRVDIVDMRLERKRRYALDGGRTWRLLSIQLEKQMQQTLEAGGQIMLLLNRRGYANYIACADHRCAWQKYCDYCDATMVYHRGAELPKNGVVRCHHCGAEQQLPRRCPNCDKKVTTFGLGTQRVEEEIARICPDRTILRMDSDSMRRSRDYHEALERFRHGEIDILLGTQMIAKGLDFPNVRLVGVISADTALHLPDFRAAERTFQLIAQVAGRAGRGAEAGRVIVQTYSADDPVIALASRHDYETFAKRELALRMRMGLPPISRMARLVVRDRDLGACVKRATALAAHLRTFNRQLGDRVRLRGPAPCPIARIADYHRQQIELLAPPPDAAGTLQKLMTALRNARLLVSDAHVAVDVDPVSLL